MKCYIEFYYNDENRLNAEIHKQGKYRIVRKKKNIDKLIEIIEKHGYKVNGACRINDKVITISREFDKYMAKQKSKLHILGEIVSNMKISHKDPSKNKKIVVGTLIGVLTIAGITNIKNNTNNTTNDKVISAEINQEETPLNELIKETTSKKEIKNKKQNIETKKINKPIIKEKKIVEKKRKKQTKDELKKIFEEESFHFSYEDRTNKENIINSKRYEDIFEKYSKMYGLDKNLLMALSAQESSGDHYNHLDNGPACGIMQIEKAAHIGSTVSAYNFNTNQVETIKINNNIIKDLDTNIKIGSMILREYIENTNYNIPLALQTYNFGPGNMNKVLNACSYLENININEITNNQTNNEWLNYRNFLNTGDPEYVEHVFSYLDNNTELTVLDRNGNRINVKISNDYEKSKHY